MMLSIFMAAMMFGVQEDPYILILTNNKQMKVAQAPECNGKTCKIRLLDGEVTSLPARMIDQEKTRAFNEQLASQREEEARARAEAAKAEEEAQAAAGEAEEKREIKLSRYEKLPAGDPNANALVSTEAPDENPAAGPPRTRNFSSSDPVYVSFEQVTPFEQDYEVVYDLKTNESNGVQNVNVRVKVVFSEGLPEETTQSVANISPDEVSRLTFRVKNNGEIVQIGYNIDYDVLKNE